VAKGHVTIESRPQARIAIENSSQAQIAITNTSGSAPLIGAELLIPFTIGGENPFARITITSEAAAAIAITDSRQALITIESE
jgi:hypothetical protein